jgi:hypothetical protein
MLLGILSAVSLVCYWYFGHRPIAYHNDRIRSAIGNAIALEISLVPQIGAGGEFVESKPPKRITDRSQVDKVLRGFILPWYARASGKFHECGGHLEVRIERPDSTSHLVRFDHGNGIYPIDQGDQSPGFSQLSDSACSFLVDYFVSLGYSRRDLGMDKEEE